MTLLWPGGISAHAGGMSLESNCQTPKRACITRWDNVPGKFLDARVERPRGRRSDWQNNGLLIVPVVDGLHDLSSVA
jgi:hypothetical protein